MFDQSLINPLLIGDELYESLKSIPKYDELICHKDTTFLRTKKAMMAEPQKF